MPAVFAARIVPATLEVRFVKLSGHKRLALMAIASVVLITIPLHRNMKTIVYQEPSEERLSLSVRGSAKTDGRRTPFVEDEENQS